MDVIHIGPTILCAIAWGCSLNIITAPAIAGKEGWVVPEIFYTTRFRTVGKIGMAVSMFLAVLSAGWWGLLFVPAGGALFGAISTAIFRDAMMAVSIPIGIFANLGCGIWLYFVF